MRKISSYIVLCTFVLLSACTSAPKYQTTAQSDINRLTKSASFEMPKVQVQPFPNRTYNVLDYGADPNQ